MERSFDLQLQELKDMVVLLGEITKKAVRLAAELTTGENLSVIEEIVRLEKESDQLETKLQKRASTLMALYQPVAGDLRWLLTSMNIAHELERIADQCLNIVQRITESKELLFSATLPIELFEMTARMQEMVDDVHQAYIRQDTELAQEIIGRDIFLDDLKTRITNKYFELITKNEVEPALAVAYILISRHIEKIGDLAKNVAEEVFYLVHGEFIKHKKVPDIYN